MEKEDQIRLALKIAIEQKYPTNIHGKAIALELSDSQVSKILGRKNTLPLREIIRLEKKMGIEILKVIIPDSSSVKQEVSGKNDLSEKTNSAEIDVTDTSLYCKMQPDRRSEVRTLIADLKKELTRIIAEKHLRFEERAKSAYISINLLSEDSNINNTKGIHLLFFRYNPNKKILRVHFIIPNKFFIDEIQEERLTLGGTQTSYLPLKKSRRQPSEYTFQGQPYLDLQEIGNFAEFKEKVIKLALRVFELQSSDIKERTE